MFRTPFVAVLALLAAAPSLPRTAEPAAAAQRRSYSPMERVGWSYGDASLDGGRANQVRLFKRDPENFSWSIGPENGADVRAVIDSIARGRPGDGLSFNLVREAGTLACTGAAEDGGRASGRCRFDPDEGFAAELARRGIMPANSRDMLELTLVDAHLATVDGLTAEGFGFGDVGDLIAVSAVGVSPAYAGELRGGGLKVGELGDLIAAKSLKIDALWLGEMARAGYPNLAVGQAIQMRTLGITPDYARKMGRILRAVHEIE